MKLCLDLPITTSTSVSIFQTIMEAKPNKLGLIWHFIIGISMDLSTSLVYLDLGELLFVILKIPH